MTEKYTKVEAEYGKGKPQHHCGQLTATDKNYCGHFMPGRSTTGGRCAVVIGPIARNMGCKYFERAE